MAFLPEEDCNAEEETATQSDQGRDDEQRLTADIVELARQYGRYGYRKIAELMRTTAGWVVNDKRVERVWRREGLKVPATQPNRGRLWLSVARASGSDRSIAVTCGLDRTPRAKGEASS